MVHKRSTERGMIRLSVTFEVRWHAIPPVTPTWKWTVDVRASTALEKTVEGSRFNHDAMMHHEAFLAWYRE